jgi:8-amino-7-oxononanoate synthase
LQKAVGCYGGFISGTAQVIDYLRLTSKAYIFSGTLQPSAVEGALTSVRLIKSAEGKALRADLKRKSLWLRTRLSELGYRVHEGDSPIVSVIIGKDIATLMAGRKVFDLGIYLNSVLYPAVPRDEGVLRISVNTPHTDQDLERLVAAFSHLKVYLQKFELPVQSAAHVFSQVIKSKWQGARYAGL